MKGLDADERAILVHALTWPPVSVLYVQDISVVHQLVARGALALEGLDPGLVGARTTPAGRLALQCDEASRREVVP